MTHISHVHRPRYRFHISYCFRVIEDGIIPKNFWSGTYQEVLPHVTLPVLLIQARGDPTVRPESAQQIYARLQSPHKQLLWKERNRHVIVSQHDADVHRDIFSFLQHHSPLVVPPPPP